MRTRLLSRSTAATTTTPDLTVVIPAYNEGQRLPLTLAGLKAELDQWPLEYRVLVVDDGSRDGSWEAVTGFDDRFACCRLAVNSGKGAAVRTGMLQATGDVVAFTDADLPFDLAALRAGYELISRGVCDVVCGDRTAAKTDAAAQSAPWLRRVSGFVFRQLVGWIAAPCVADTQCGLKVFSQAAAKEIFRGVAAPGFAFDVEVICRAARLGFAIETVPVHLVNTAGSTISLRRHAWPMVKELLAIRRRLAAPANDSSARAPVPLPLSRAA